MSVTLSLRAMTDPIENIILYLATKRNDIRLDVLKVLVSIILEVYIYSSGFVISQSNSKSQI